MFIQNKSVFVHIIVFLIALVALPANAGWAAVYSVHFDNEERLLSIHADKIALGELLISVSKKTGVQFRLDPSLDKIEISVDFSRKPLMDGIKKILGSLSSAIVYDESGKIKEVIICEHGKTYREDINQKETGISHANLNSLNKNDRLLNEYKNQDNSGMQNGPDLLKETSHTDQNPPIKETPSNDDGPPKDNNERYSGPPEQKNEHFTGPPDRGNEGLLGPPLGQVSDHPPPGKN